VRNQRFATAVYADSISLPATELTLSVRFVDEANDIF
jgi:hypothetical protein